MGSQATPFGSRFRPVENPMSAPTPKHAVSRYPVPALEGLPEDIRSRILAAYIPHICGRISA